MVIDGRTDNSRRRTWTFALKDHPFRRNAIYEVSPKNSDARPVSCRRTPSSEPCTAYAMHGRRHEAKRLTLQICANVELLHLVFGKAVQVRHYPVTVFAENRTWSLLRPLRLPREGCSDSPKRKSGDRPDANLGLIQLRWESWRAFPCRSG